MFCKWIWIICLIYDFEGVSVGLEFRGTWGLGLVTNDPQDKDSLYNLFKSVDTFVKEA